MQTYIPQLQTTPVVSVGWYLSSVFSPDTPPQIASGTDLRDVLQAEFAERYGPLGAAHPALGVGTPGHSTTSGRSARLPVAEGSGVCGW